MFSQWHQPENAAELNLHSHCLLCLQHVDPQVLEEIALVTNLKGFANFQPILQYLTGTVNPRRYGVGARKFRYYPVAGNIPPLCIVCYEILAELNGFHEELRELQRKIQNQTEAARRIARATQSGGVKEEFLKRLRNGGLPGKETEEMDSFMGNFHGLILEADGKAVLPEAVPMGYNEEGRSEGEVTWGLTPYFVRFKELVKARREEEVVGEVEPEVVDLGEEEEAEQEVMEGNVVLEGNGRELQFEFEGDEEEEGVEEEVTVEQKVYSEEMDEEYKFEGEVEENEEDEEVAYWKEMLGNQLDIEAVDPVKEVPASSTSPKTRRLLVKRKNIEVIQIEDDEEEEEHEDLDDSSFELEYRSKNEGTVGVVGRGNGKFVQFHSSGQMLSSSISNPTKKRSIVDGAKEFPCEQCGKEFKTRQRLRHHQLEHLPGGRPRPFKCASCNKQFSSGKLLEQHFRIHTGERPFKCEICGDAFRQGSTLYRHKISHQRHQNQGSRRKQRLPSASEAIIY